MRDRESTIPPEDSLAVAQKVKEQMCYVCPDLAKEFGKYDSNPAEFIKKFESVYEKTQRPWSCDVGYEQFLGPEVFFHPETFSSDFTTPLPDVVDAVIQSSPIDTRRDLYENIVLSGGSTMFKNFGKRLERDLQRIVDERLMRAQAKSRGIQIAKIDCNVISHSMQRYAVWFGGSVLGATVCAPSSVPIQFLLFSLFLAWPSLLCNRSYSRSCSFLFLYRSNSTRSVPPKLNTMNMALVLLAIVVFLAQSRCNTSNLHVQYHDVSLSVFVCKKIFLYKY